MLVFELFNNLILEGFFYFILQQVGQLWNSESISFIWGIYLFYPNWVVLLAMQNENQIMCNQEQQGNKCISCKHSLAAQWATLTHDMKLVQVQVSFLFLFT